MRSPEGGYSLSRRNGRSGGGARKKEGSANAWRWSHWDPAQSSFGRHSRRASGRENRGGHRSEGREAPCLSWLQYCSPVSARSWPRLFPWSGGLLLLERERASHASQSLTSRRSQVKRGQFMGEGQKAQSCFIHTVHVVRCFSRTSHKLFENLPPLFIRTLGVMGFTDVLKM